MTLHERDRKTIWHPFTQMKLEPPHKAIVKGEGVYLIDEDGHRYIDAIGSWWVNTHGHSHPYIAEKVAAQLKQLEHVIFAGFTHPPAVELAERLLELLPASQQKIFFSDNGSTAVEVALKMAFQYWHNQGAPRYNIVALKNAYHGDTFGAMSVSGPGYYTDPFKPNLFKVHFIDTPVEGQEDTSLQQLRDIIDNEGDIAAFIAEPLVHGAEGMIMYPAAALDDLIAEVRKTEALVIADEVMTGFGRTGKMFASDHLQQPPDIFCLSKGLTAGTMAMGVTSCTQAIYDQFYADDKLKTFFHGHSFTANPLACTAALAGLDLHEKENTPASIQRINKAHQSFLKRLTAYNVVDNPRALGIILAFEIATGEANSYLHSQRDQFYRFFMERGVLLRPLGNTIYILPPYCITNEQLDEVYGVIIELLEYLKQGKTLVASN